MSRTLRLFVEITKRKEIRRREPPDNIRKGNKKNKVNRSPKKKKNKKKSLKDKLEEEEIEMVKNDVDLRISYFKCHYILIAPIKMALSLEMAPPINPLA